MTSASGPGMSALTVRGSGRLRLHPHQQLRDRGVAVEGHRAGDHLVEDQTERVEIDAMVHLSARHLFRRHVARRAEQLAAARHVGGRGQRLRQAEVRDVRRARVIDQDVVRLQVAVDDAFGVRGGERVGDLPRDRDGALDRQPAFAAQDAVQILAVHEGHRDELEALDFAQVVDAEDVLVRDLRAEEQLLLEPLDG